MGDQFIKTSSFICLALTGYYLYLAHTSLPRVNFGLKIRFFAWMALNWVEKE
jgi:hypothetical protein